jgi:hypothetical protein
LKPVIDMAKAPRRADRLSLEDLSNKQSLQLVIQRSGETMFEMPIKR